MCLSAPDRRPSRRAALALAVLLLVGGSSAAPATAQATSGSAPEGGLHVHLVKLRNQPAEEAMKLVMPLLSSQGSVEIQPGSNTLVIRDTLAALSRMLPLLADFDHSRRAVEIEVWILRATPSQVSPPGASAPEIQNLPGLVETLRRHLPYQNYEVVTKSDVRSREGEFAVVPVAEGFQVRFRLGTVIGNQRLRLGGFEVLRSRGGGEATNLLKSDLNLWVDRPAVISLVNPANEEKGEGTLLIVVRIELPGPAIPGRDGN